MKNIRRPAVAGQFYPEDPKELTALIDKIYAAEKDNIRLGLAQKKLLGGIAPHAGFTFSAYQAIHLFDIIRHHPVRFDTFFIINPSHTGVGHDIAYDSSDFWESPLGMVSVDKDFSEHLRLPVSRKEEEREHSGEVMIPLMQHFLDYEFQIAPVTLTLQNHKNARKLAKAIYETNKKLNKKILIIASSDFSHFETSKVGREKDQLVLDKIENLDAPGVEQAVQEHHISVCGFGPIMTLIEYAGLVSKNPHPQILKRGSSGDIIPSNEVVDYVSVLFYEEPVQGD